MSGLETFVWGLAGAFVTYLAVFVAIMLAMIIGGGLLAVAIGDASEPKHAFFYGAGWEGFIKGAGEGGSMFKKSPS